MTVKDFIKIAKENVSEGWIIAALTDDYIVDRWPVYENEMLSKEEKILEIRVFNDQEENRLSRSDIGKELVYRRISDREDERDTYDEWQFLDIDEKKGKDSDGEVTATGGGKYNLPLSSIKDAKIRIRYYMGKYAATGQARIEDWRVVELREGE